MKIMVTRMKFEEYTKFDAIGLKELLDKGEVSAKELVQTALNAIEVLNPKLNFPVVVP